MKKCFERQDLIAFAAKTRGELVTELGGGVRVEGERTTTTGNT